MRILLTLVGSAGDNLPFIGLGSELMRRGHDVTVATSEHFAALVRDCGMRFLTTGTEREYEAAVTDPAVFDARKGFAAVMRLVGEYNRRLFDVVMAERRAGPVTVVAHTLDFASRVVADGSPLPPVWRIFLHQIHSELLTLALFPQWYAPPQPDWPASLRQCDFPLFDAPGTADLSGAVEAFLRKGPAPIAFTPGSAMRFGHRLFEVAVAACASLGRRGLLLTRDRDPLPPRLPPGVAHFDYVPLSAALRGTRAPRWHRHDGCRIAPRRLDAHSLAAACDLIEQTGPDACAAARVG